MKNYLVLLCLTAVGSAAALSNTLESLMAHASTRAACEKLSMEEREILDAYLAELEVLIFEANRDAAYLGSQHAKASTLMQELIGSDQLACQVIFSPVVRTTVPLENEQEPRFVS